MSSDEPVLRRPGSLRDLRGEERMYWSYRIMRHERFNGDEVSFGLYEVHFDDDGTPMLYSQHPCGFIADSLEELRKLIECAVQDAWTKPVLTAADFAERSVP
jgi:hypothetical protein